MIADPVHPSRQAHGAAYVRCAKVITGVGTVSVHQTGFLGWFCTDVGGFIAARTSARAERFVKISCEITQLFGPAGSFFCVLHTMVLRDAPFKAQITNWRGSPYRKSKAAKGRRMYQLKDFGSYTAGGRKLEVSDQPIETIQFTPTTSYQFNPNGHHLIEHAYVQYFVPQERNSEPTVVLVHGGGMTGKMWETTPDGRPGWLHLLLGRGFEVHVVDNVERGRAGWHPNIWEGEPIIRTMEEAWSLFRIGSTENFASRTAFSGQRFPVEHFEGLCRGFVPRWTSTLNCQADALASVISGLGTTHVICHSQGTQVVFTAAEQCADHIQRITALEPSGLPTAPLNVPLKMVFGDYLDATETWRGLIARCEAYMRNAPGPVTWLDLTEAGLPGHSHMMMMDLGNHDVLQTLMSES